jgi:hypothetical protein
VIEDHGAFKIGFVEFGDDGKRLQRDKQVRVVIDTVRDARKLNKQTGAVTGDTIGGLTVIYAHGWKNNAMSREGYRKDVEKFRDFLRGLAQEVKPTEGTPALPVMGVYLGWHGKSVDIDSGFLNWWTLWPRYFAAGRVGSEEMQRTIAQAIQAGVAGRKQLTEEKRPRVILIGHSLGARVLEGALQQVQGAEIEEEASQSDPKRGLILGQCTNLQKGLDVKSVVDLTLLVNEATKSRRVREATKACYLEPKGNAMVRHPASSKENCPPNSKEARCQPYPIFVHIASSADWATRFLAPVALLGRTAPHTSRLWTHRVNDIAKVPPSESETIFKFQTQEENPRTYAVTRLDPKAARNPVWVMRVDGHIVKNHGDIWNESFQNMIKGLMGGLAVVELRSYSPESKTQQAQPAPPKSAPVK